MGLFDDQGFQLFVGEVGGDEAVGAILVADVVGVIGAVQGQDAVKILHGSQYDVHTKNPPRLKVPLKF